MPKSFLSYTPLLFFIINFLLRVSLAIFDINNTGLLSIPAIFFGVVSDVAVLCYLAPLALFSKLNNKIILFIATFFIIFTAISEFVFWSEFSCRFNFIAVDYLIYTKEVIGNIKESYNMVFIISFVALLSLIFVYFSKKLCKANKIKNDWKKRLFILLLPFAAFYLYDSSYLEFSNNRYVNEITKNGLYELFSAYRNNDLPFDKFYITKNQEELTKELRKTVSSDEPNTVFLNSHDISRKIVKKGKELKLNIILITVESLSASFLKKFGNIENITPNLDDLCEKSMVFTNLLATGTRTVQGLSAISLSIPPIPGNSIVRRPNNENLSTISNILKSKGYDCKFIYGGFGYFDNMNYFFENNGCKIIDRSSLKKKEITFSNIWGICDEDLFNATIKELDKSYDLKKPFFSMVMATSNHRPYTYADGKIDIPSKTGRNGAVKYTDFAIGDFIKKSCKKPWFNDTIFIITADHTAGSAGKISLDPSRYHIPLIIYSPSNIKPQRIDKLASQIDIAPTILSLLNMSYESKFFGHDIVESKNERAFISNYQQVGYLTNSELYILKPFKKFAYYKKENNIFIEDRIENFNEPVLEYFQSAINWKVWNHF